MARNLVQLKDSDNNNMYPMNPSFQITSEADLVTLYNKISMYESIQIRMNASVCNSLFGENATGWGIIGKSTASVMDSIIEIGSNCIVTGRFQNGVLTGYKKYRAIDSYQIIEVSKTLESLAAGTGNYVDINYTLPSGYVVGGVTVINRSALNIVPIWIDAIYNNYIRVRIYNARTSPITNVPITARILLLPSA